LVEENAMSVKRKGGKTIEPARSRKAGRPPEEIPLPPRVRRRQKTAHAAFRKDTTIHQAAAGPRVMWGVTKPKVKKG
jgi:hypothetical protein